MKYKICIRFKRQIQAKDEEKERTWWLYGVRILGEKERERGMRAEWSVQGMCSTLTLFPSKERLDNKSNVFTMKDHVLYYKTPFSFKLRESSYTKSEESQERGRERIHTGDRIPGSVSPSYSYFDIKTRTTMNVYIETWLQHQEFWNQQNAVMLRLEKTLKHLILSRESFPTSNIIKERVESREPVSHCVSNSVSKRKRSLNTMRSHHRHRHHHHHDLTQEVQGEDWGSVSRKKGDGHKKREGWTWEGETSRFFEERGFFILLSFQAAYSCPFALHLLSFDLPFFPPPDPWLQSKEV